MEDDLIIVDDETTTEPLIVPLNGASSSRIPKQAGGSSTGAGNATARQSSESERATRSVTIKGKPQPKLKLKLSEKAAAQAPGMSFLGSYDRELDSDDEDLAFEEQFILRMPPGEDCEKLRKMVAAREVSNDVWFKFKGELRSRITYCSYSR
jgi:transcription initiation factor TFIID subunit 7